MATTATTVNKSIVEIRGVFCSTVHHARVKLGSLEPFCYVVKVAFRCEPPLGPCGKNLQRMVTRFRLG